MKYVLYFLFLLQSLFPVDKNVKNLFAVNATLFLLWSWQDILYSMRTLQKNWYRGIRFGRPVN